MEYSGRSVALLVWCRSIGCFNLESGLGLMNVAHASVSYIAVKVDRTQKHQGREMRGAPLLIATCARQKDRYVRAHVRVTHDDDPARLGI